MTANLVNSNRLWQASEKDGFSGRTPLLTGSGMASVDLYALHKDLAQLVSTCSSEQAFLKSIVDLVGRLTNAETVSYFRAKEAATLEVGLQSTSPGLHSEAQSSADGMSTWADSAQRQQRLVVTQLDAGLVALAAPVMISAKRVDAFCAIVRLEKDAVASVSIILQLVAGHVTLWHAHRATRDLDCEVSNSAALLEVIGAIAQRTCILDAAQQLVEEARKYLGSDRVALGLVAPGELAAAWLRYLGLPKSIRRRPSQFNSKRF